jgi:hypothetical protein
MKRLNTFLMTVTLEPVAVIFLGWLQLRKSYVSTTFGPLFSKIVLRQSKNAHPAKFFTKRHAPTLLCCIPLLPSAPLPNGALISCSVILPQLGGTVTSSCTIDYFTKWVEAMPTFLNDGHTATLFLFNHIITRFGVPQAIVTDHGSHFQNKMMSDLHAKLGFLHENSSPYYPQANGKVEAIKKVLKTMIQLMVGENKTSWHLQLLSALWAYHTSVKNATRFTPF